uniref:Uncharacterized protein n=1 Tax=Rhizophora mucronata TaxID=61149 RepID=A0A2P2P3S0_RHIMU
MSPSSSSVRWHMWHEFFMQVRNSRNLEAFFKIVSSSFLIIFLFAGGGWTSTKRQWDILSTSKPCKPSKMRTNASLCSLEHRRLKVCKFGRYETSVHAK